MATEQDHLDMAVSIFAESVIALAETLGMQAYNDIAKRTGATLYDQHE